MTPCAGRSIMVIGFDANFCYLMHRFGQISACPVVFARQDEDILSQVRASRPWVIFLEVVHTGSFASRLCQQLKADRETGAIPVIICSWQGEDWRGGPERADFYVRLPILYEHFKAALEHIAE